MKSIAGSDVTILGQTALWGRFLGYFDLQRIENPNMTLNDCWQAFLDRHSPKVAQTQIASPAANLAYLFMVISFVRESYTEALPELNEPLEKLGLSEGIDVLDGQTDSRSLKLRNVIRRCRNALAHGSYTWEPDGITLRDENPRDKKDKLHIKLTMYAAFHLAESLLAIVAAAEFQR